MAQRIAAALLALAVVGCSDPPPPAAPVDPNAFVLGPGFAPDPQVKGGMAGGPVEASQRNGDCRGYIATSPNHTLVLAQAAPHLRIVVHSTGDPTLVVQLADGTMRCNDDSEGLNSMVEGPFPAGTHAIYVGTYSSGPQAPYSIGVGTSPALQPSTIAGNTPAPPPPPPPPPPPSPTPPPGVPSGRQPTIEVSDGFSPDPRVQQSWAAGVTSGTELGYGCTGHYSEPAQHAVQVRRPMAQLRFLVSAELDTTLAVRGPDGAMRCNDDSDGLNPAIEGPFEPGLYTVHVGTYSQGQGTAYRLAVTTGPLTAAELAALPAPGGAAGVVPMPYPDDPPPPPPPPVDPTGARNVPGALPGDMNPQGLTPAQQAAADAASISYYEARELHRCAACMRQNDFDHCIMSCREPCLECVSTGAASESRCGIPCGGRR